MGIISKLLEQLKRETFATKLATGLQKNPDFHMMKGFAKIFEGTSMDLGGADHNTPFLFSCAPMTSIDCERSFSRLKSILSDQRTSLTEARMHDMLLIQWNKVLIK